MDNLSAGVIFALVGTQKRLPSAQKRLPNHAEAVIKRAEAVTKCAEAVTGFRSLCSPGNVFRGPPVWFLYPSTTCTDPCRAKTEKLISLVGHKRPVKTRWPAVRGITEKARTRSPPSGTKPRDGFYGPAEAAGDGNRYIRPMTLLGYARVSTDDQSASLQQDALSAAGCWKTFTDVGSGARASRPELDRLIDQLRPGDTVVVWRLDRLGRSIQHLIEQLKVFEEMGVEFRSLQENIDTSTSGGRLVFHIFASLAEFERDLIKERTQAGLQAARARGRVGGRPRTLSDGQARTIRGLYDAGELTVAEIADQFGVSRKTIYRTLDRTDGRPRRRGGGEKAQK